MIISASRRCDIPAYFGEWMLHRLREGYVLIRNPMNPRQVSRVSLSPGGDDRIKERDCRSDAVTQMDIFSL
ncbi:MAG: DUF1848 family protein [Clostridia bacterium]|nr:DUF1848 family protein [Clostridia bacterium]